MEIPNALDLPSHETSKKGNVERFSMYFKMEFSNSLNRFFCVLIQIIYLNEFVINPTDNCKIYYRVINVLSGGSITYLRTIFLLYWTSTQGRIFKVQFHLAIVKMVIDY